MKDLKELFALLEDERTDVRPREMHRNYCAHCPSHPRFESDPITIELQTYPREVRLQEGVFVCAWRTEKMCRGICERLGITAQDLAEAPPW